MSQPLSRPRRDRDGTPRKQRVHEDFSRQDESSRDQRQPKPVQTPVRWGTATGRIATPKTSRARYTRGVRMGMANRTARLSGARPQPGSVLVG
jgi:hypothetical protein